MIGAHEKAGAAENEYAVPDEIPVLPHMFFLACEHGDDEYHGDGIEKTALYPAELARSEMRKFGIEQTSHNSTGGNNE